MEEEQKTQSKTYDWLKPHQFKEGNPGGPGRPKGPTLKTWIKNYFSEMTDEERVVFLNKIDPIKAWEMGEGKAESKTESKVEVTLPTPLLANIPTEDGVSSDNSTEENTESQEAN